VPSGHPLNTPHAPAVWRKLKGNQQEREINAEWESLKNAGSPMANIQKFKLAWSKKQTEEDIKEISQLWERRQKRWREQRETAYEDREWLRIKESKRDAIKARFSHELQCLKNMQQAEIKEAIRSTEKADANKVSNQVERPDLNQASAVHAVYLHEASRF
jgi:hypothetical protein